MVGTATDTEEIITIASANSVIQYRVVRVFYYFFVGMSVPTGPYPLVIIRLERAYFQAQAVKIILWSIVQEL